MIAYVILRPDGTEVEGSVRNNSHEAWRRAVFLEGRDYAARALSRKGYRLHSFEVPLPAPKAQEAKP